MAFKLISFQPGVVSIYYIYIIYILYISWIAAQQDLVFRIQFKIHTLDSIYLHILDYFLDFTQSSDDRDRNRSKHDRPVIFDLIGDNFLL